MSAIRSAIKDFDPAPAVAAEQKALLAALDNMAKSKVAQMKAEIHESLLGAGAGTNLTIPVVLIEDERGETHATSIDTLSEKIPTAVGDSTKKFVSGGTENIVSGIMGLVTSALETFLGSGDASEDTLERTYVAMSGVGLWRIDLRAWYYQVEGSGISTKVERVSAFYYTRSTVNVDKLPFQTFLNQYQMIASSASPPPTPEALEDEIGKLRKLFDMLKTQKLNSLAVPVF